MLIRPRGSPSPDGWSFCVSAIFTELAALFGMLAGARFLASDRKS